MLSKGVLESIFKLNKIIDIIVSIITGHFFLRIPDKPKSAVIKYMYTSGINVHNDPFTAIGYILSLKTPGRVPWDKTIVFFITDNIFILNKYSLIFNDVTKGPIKNVVNKIVEITPG